MEIAYIFKDDDVEVQITNRFTAFDVQLSKNSPSLHLIQQTRDEAHRFAIRYHRKLRSKSAIK